MTERVHRNALQPGYKLHWYEIKSILGQGGFGITYLAHDLNLDRLVAIKEYLPTEFAVRDGDLSVHPAADSIKSQYEWGLDRFISEARTLSRFEHPNIVRVYAVFEENNTGYMVMPYEKGHSLQAILSKKKTLNEATLLSVIEPLLDGLNLIHKEGFIHRDIKPDNIFIREDGSPVLLDFGSARQAIAGKTKTLTTLVTPGYAPFEQYYSKSDEQGPWTDIYGLGATLYRAISGRAPMDAVDRSKSMLDGTKDNFVSASEIGIGKYTEKFLSAIDHAIRFKINDRPQTVSEWHTEITTGEEQIVTEVATNFDNIIAAEKPEVEAKSAKPYKKWLVASLVLVLLAGASMFYLDAQKQQADVSRQQLVAAGTPPESQGQAEKQAVSQTEEAESSATVKAEQERAGELEKQRIADEKRRAEQQALDAETKRLEQARRLEAERQLELDRAKLAEERQRFEAEIARKKEQERLAEVEKQKQLEEQRRRAEQRKAAEEEKKRRAEEQRIAAEKLRAEAAEKERLAELEREKQAEQQRRLENQRREEQARLAELQRQQQEVAARREQESLEQERIEQRIEASRAEFSARLATAQDKLGFVDSVSATDLTQVNDRQLSSSVSALLDKWQNTGVEIKRGKTYKVRASGEWSMGPLCQKTGPTGDGMYTIACWDLGHQTVAKRSHSALIGKIGQQSLAFYVGSEFTFTADKDGPFYMMSNDAPGFFFDNTGAINVSISLDEF